MSDRLDRKQVAELMGWTNPNNINTALHRSRHPQDFPGSVKFPEPGEDGKWERVAVERYRDSRSNRGTGLSEMQRRRIVRLHAAGLDAEDIAYDVGCRRGSVYRVLKQNETQS
jgi:hypothetical protein